MKPTHSKARQIEVDVSTEDRLFRDITLIARLAARRLVDAETASDIAQDVATEFLVALRMDMLRRDARSLTRFAAHRARCRATDWLRRGSHRPGRESDWMLDVATTPHVWMHPDLALNEAELAEAQRRTLEALPPMCRRVFLMVRDGERSYEDVARTLGVSRSTICLHISEAQRRFRHELQRHDVAPTRGVAGRRRPRGNGAQSHPAQGEDSKPLPLAALSLPATYTYHGGRTYADEAGQHAAIAEERGSVSRPAR